MYVYDQATGLCLDGGHGRNIHTHQGNRYQMPVGPGMLGTALGANKRLDPNGKGLSREWLRECLLTWLFACHPARARPSLAGFAAVRDEQASVPVAASGDHRCPADGELVACGVPIILRLLGDGVVAGWRQGVVPDQYGFPPEPLALLQREPRAKPSMMRSAADFDTPNSGASCRSVRLVRQYAATSSTRSSSGRLHGLPSRSRGVRAGSDARLRWTASLGRRLHSPAPTSQYVLAESRGKYRPAPSTAHRRRPLVGGCAAALPR